MNRRSAIFLGRRTIDGKVYYLADWEPTWMAESELDEAKGLIEGFVTQL